MAQVKEVGVKPYFQVRTVSFREGNIEPENRGLVQMIFLFHGGQVSGSMFIFQGV